MKRVVMVSAISLMVVLVLATLSAYAGTLTVRTTDAATGAVLANALVVVSDGQAVLAAGRTSPEGTWTGNVTTQAATVIAARELYVTGTRSVSIGAEGEQTLSFALRNYQPQDFNRLGRIVGFVRNAAGNPIPNATLVLIREGTPAGAAQSKEPAGIYELQWYAPGAYSVLATAPGHGQAVHTGQKITAGESLWLDITLQAN